MKLFPNIQICSISLDSKNENTFVPGVFIPRDNLIQIDKKAIKTNHPDCWKRQIVVVFLHEFSHFLYNEFKTYPCSFKNIDMIELFKDELIAYKVQKVVEKLLFVEHDFNVDEGATLSVTAMVHQFKQHYGIT